MKSLCRLCSDSLAAFQNKDHPSVNEDSGLEVIRNAIRHQPSRDALREAALSGCIICKRMHDTFGASVETTGGRLPLQLSFNMSASVGKDKELVLHVGNDSSPGLSTGITLMPVDISKDKPRLQNYRATSISSQASIDLAKSWLSECRTSHKRCAHAFSANPTRLVHITKNPSSIRLIDGDSLPPGTTYLTLSHCWGIVPDKIVLLKEYLKAWKREIPSLGRMKTFTDAIKVANELGISYLWIDSLCIKQDDEDDWLKESARMGDVYANAICNIAASASSDDTGGLFANREPGYDLAVRFCFGIKSRESIASDEAAMQTAVIPTRSGRSPGVLNGVYILSSLGNDIKHEPIFKRGWIVQERILASRVLYFTAKELQWECIEMRRSESFPDSWPSPDYFPITKRTEFSARLQDMKQSSAVPLAELPVSQDSVALHRQKFFELWGEIVAEYSNCRLTVPTDKLPAISAVARELKPFIKSRYFAGHWEVGLIHQLGWYAEFNSRRQNPRQSGYRCPSWAWPSIDGEVSKFKFIWPCHPLAKVVDIDVKLENAQDEMGPVRGGHLTLHGQLLPAQFQQLILTDSGSPGEEQKKTYYLRLYINGEEYRAPWAFDDIVGDEYGAGEYRISSQLNTMVLPGHKYVQVVISDNLKDGFCVPLDVSSTSRSGLNETCGYSISALLLQKVNDSNVFRRLGYAGSQGNDITAISKPCALLKAVGRFEKQQNDIYHFSEAARELRDITII